jgi:3-deoxy-7-phosphoheptulonate synthase
MLIVMSYSATKAEIAKVVKAVQDMGYRAEPIPGAERTAIGVLGNKGYVDDAVIQDLPEFRKLSTFLNRTSWVRGLFTPRAP